jgi:alkanesulfonate monooxygenase SsuD/methylene tetrahydromethanopterin reductase-like flavin-dependent oxidoreductase (luciferase family)
MALNNIKGVIAGGTAKGSSAEKTAEKYQEALSRKGNHTILGENLALAVNFYIDDSMAKAEKKAKIAFEEYLKVIGPLGIVPELTSEQISELKNIKGVINTDGLPTFKDAVKEGNWVCGTPEHIIEKIKDIEERFPGLERISMGAGHLGIGPKSIVEILSHFGEKVIPVFKT